MIRAATLTTTGLDEFVPFLTAWDPSDLPGGSVDPLGFDRGYNSLADKLLPGLTNVARQPRYLSLLCAGASLGSQGTKPSRAEIQERQDTVLRLEKLWAIANVLAAEEKGTTAEGVRGVSYAERHRETLARGARRSTGTGFLLLSRQVQYGVLGIYGNVANGMQLIERKTFNLSPAYGERLGEAFFANTLTPKSVLAAATDPEGEVGLDALRAWGARAGLTSPPAGDEALLLSRALRSNPNRRRVAEALEKHPAKDGESELDRLKRIGESFDDRDADLGEAITAILAFEDCYRWVLLGFERMLWLCRAGGSKALAELSSDEVVARAAKSLRPCVRRLEVSIDEATSPSFKKDLERLKEVRAFLSAFGGTGSDAASHFVDRVLRHHADVQHGKLDQGRRKLPWIEVEQSRAVLTLARSPQVATEPSVQTDTAAHEYRTASADALVWASKEAAS